MTADEFTPTEANFKQSLKYTETAGVHDHHSPRVMNRLRKPQEMTCPLSMFGSASCGERSSPFTRTMAYMNLRTPQQIE
jgi:hypothetical protein